MPVVSATFNVPSVNPVQNPEESVPAVFSSPVMPSKFHTATSSARAVIRKVNVNRITRANFFMKKFLLKIKSG